jgi:hypothetical protein
MKKVRVRSGAYKVEMPYWSGDNYDGAAADEETLTIEFDYTPEDKPQYYESRGQAPHPGNPELLEVTKITKEDGTTLDWDSLSNDFQCVIEERCWEHIADLSEPPE